MKGHIGPDLRFRGVSDGARTRDNRDHNPVLYQLSYTHHEARASIAERWREAQPVSGRSAVAAAAASSEVGPGCGTKTVER
jgi:hypothetical protein